MSAQIRKGQTHWFAPTIQYRPSPEPKPPHLSYISLTKGKMAAFPLPIMGRLITFGAKYADNDTEIENPPGDNHRRGPQLRGLYLH